jgi:hypothetical protein
MICEDLQRRTNCFQNSKNLNCDNRFNFFLKRLTPLPNTKNLGICFWKEPYLMNIIFCENQT